MRAYQAWIAAVGIAELGVAAISDRIVANIVDAAIETAALVSCRSAEDAAALAARIAAIPYVSASPPPLRKRMCPAT
jgi:hypothetical protein